MDLLRCNCVVNATLIRRYMFIQISQVGLGSSSFGVFANSLTNVSSVFRHKFTATFANRSRSLLGAYFNSNYRFFFGFFLVWLYAISLIITIRAAMGAVIFTMIYGMSQDGRMSTISRVFSYLYLYDLYSLLGGEGYNE